VTLGEAMTVLEPALERSGGTHTTDDLAEMLREGDAVLWLGERSALVTTSDEHPRYRALHLWLAGGDMDEIVGDLIPRAEAWGREQGCEKVTVMGRKGWERALAADGYRPAAVLLMKGLG
jgi:hypothetical protein